MIPIPNQAAVIRSEFELALRAAIDRASIFEGAEHHLQHVFTMAMSTTFQVAGDVQSVEDIFQRKIESTGAAVQILDMLHDFYALFVLGLSLHSPDLPDHLRKTVAHSTASNLPIGNLSVLPDHVKDAFVDQGTTLVTFKDNSWFYALALLRMFGGRMLSEGAPAGRRVPKGGGSVNDG